MTKLFVVTSTTLLIAIGLSWSTGLNEGHAQTMRPAAAKPYIISKPIPYPAARKRGMAAYSHARYGRSDWRLHPKMIVEHDTETATMQEAWNIFRPISTSAYPQVNVCAHYIVSRDGHIYQLVPTAIRCRHTIGLNYTAIGIENVAWNDNDFLSRLKQRSATVALTKWLACRYHIATRNIIGHAEANRHPWFYDRTGQRNDHTDMGHSAMNRIRTWVARRSC
jgi:beta-N-acetylhexosaminidase